MAQQGFPYCEPFSNGILPANTVLGGNASIISGTLGNGVLRLTSNQEYQSGYVYLDIPFPSTFGIKASFEYFSYGGNGADGLTFFLFDAAIPTFQPGAFGGALGYAQGITPESSEVSGLSGAYIGIGLDEFGNFSNAVEGKDGRGFLPNSVVIRGPGDGFSGYNYITGKRTAQETGGLPFAEQFPISSGEWSTNRVTDPDKAGYRKVFIDLQPAESGVGFVLNMEMLVTTVDNEPRMVSIFENLRYDFEAPVNLKAGFAASTGGSTNFHEIKNIVVEVSNDQSLALPRITERNENICHGDTIEFEITGNDVILPNPNSEVQCLQLYQTLEEVGEDEESDTCSKSICDPEKQRLVLDGGVFTADATEGKLSFVSDSELAVEEIVIYYTVTDSYGKTSPPEAFTLTILESPDPPLVYDRDSFDGDKPEPASAFRLCDGEQLELVVFSESEGLYQWYRNEKEIEGGTSGILKVSTAGIYTARLTNEAGCSRWSQEVEVVYPDSPPLTVDNLVVECEENFIDFRMHIEGYNDLVHDYEATAPDGNVYFNEQLSEISEGGLFELRVKHKDLDCWSESRTVEIVIVNEPLKADFEFGTITGNGGLESHRIFVDDPVQFTDLALQDVENWHWDFGDGITSSEQHPIHEYQREGNYEVVLTVGGKYCTSSTTKSLSVAGFRIMYPTAFTPLGPENRFFKPKFKGLAALKLYVFNRWGDLIHTSDDINDNGWDGTYNGRLQPNGNYVFKVEFTTESGDTHTDSGKFTLIR